MESRMVNSTTSLGSERNGNAKASYMQEVGLHKTSSSPLAANSATSGRGLLPGSDHCPKLKASTQFADLTANDCVGVLPEGGHDGGATKRTTLFCSFPLERVQTFLAKYGSSAAASNCGTKTKVTRKVPCLYCDRTFVNVNLRQKHVERCHSAKHLRRTSLRKHQNVLTSTPCIFCDQFTSAEHTLKELFRHLVEHHSNKYFGCIPCETRFLNTSHLADHHLVCPNFARGTRESSTTQDPPATLDDPSTRSEQVGSVKTVRRKYKTRKDDKLQNPIQGATSEDQRKACDVKNLRSKKLSVKSSRMILKRSKRLQAKSTESVKKKRTRDPNEKKKNNDRLEPFPAKLEKPAKTASGFVNPYPEFDHFFQVKKITDHSIDNLKISSLTFDDVFDKAFFNRIRCNIQENLMHHIDGKLFKNEESETRISNFEKNANIPQEAHSLNSENYGCELSLNAIAPTTMLLSNQLGDDPESQIEYGSKPSKKKTQLKKDEVHYKYFTRRKYQASILEHKENRDLSKLDMWTQYVIKRRQQKIQDDKRTPKEILDYFAGEEYKSTLRREELNRILDRRGPFEDLKEEVSKRAALDKLNGEGAHGGGDDGIAEIGELLNDLLNRVFELATAPSSAAPLPRGRGGDEIPSYLDLRPSTDVVPENEIDRSDKIALICSSQETENFELPSNTVRGKNEKVELTGEWARSRIYVCAACGLKLQNIKQFLEHKSATHQYIWVQHYEFVGNQSELYRHLSIPVLGKVGVLENAVQCKLWKRSDSRLCTKCGKQCNSLGELHRHILECGGDWTWMLARKKCKYRPFGAKSRRKRKGLVKRIYAQKSDVSPSEKKTYKKSYDKPSDAETIKRMLANLPPKRASRKIISLKDGFSQPRTRPAQTAKQSKFKCGKLLRQKAAATDQPQQQQKNPVGKKEFKGGKKTKHNGNYRRSLRCLSKVLTSRILDTKSTLMVRRKYNRKLKDEQTKKRDVQQEDSKEAEDVSSPKKITRGGKKNKTQQVDDEKDEDPKIKRSSPRIEKLPDPGPGDKMSIKRFFPVKKKKKSDAIKVEIKSTVPEDSSENKKAADVENDGLLISVNLRKRKVTKPDANSAKKTKAKKRGRSAKKQKLRSSPRTVTGESNPPPEPSGDSQTVIGDFFGKLAPEETAEVADAEVAEVIDRGGHEESDQQEAVETTERPEPEKSVDSSVKIENANTALSPQTKRKVKKPIRGLNDCIAMLTSKLGKSFEESATDSIFNSDATNRIVTNDRKDEYLLKVPFSNEHFHLRINHEEAATADDYCSHNVSKLPESSHQSDDIYKDTIETATASIPEETTTMNGDSFQNEENVLSDISDDSSTLQSNEESTRSFQNEEVFSQLGKIPSDVSWDNSIVLQSINDETCSDSEDEIPLSSLLKADHPAETPEDEKVDEIGEMLTAQMPETEEADSDIRQAVEAASVPESDLRSAQVKKKDVAVLTEINANLCELAENFDGSRSEPIGRRILDESVLTNSDLLLQRDDEEIRSDAKDISDLVSLEKYCEQQILSKLEKFSFFTKNSFEAEGANDITVHEQDAIDDVEKLETDTSEYKENVIRKHKQRKRTASGRSGKNHRRQAPEDNKRVSNKTNKPDDRLEFAESELIVQDGAKAVVDVIFDKPETLQVSVEVEDASTNEGSCEIIEDQALSRFIEISDETATIIENNTETVKELRRSSRNSKRITSYNETDLIDPLLDDLESDRTISRIIRETTKDIFGLKRKSRKILSQKKAKNGHSDTRKLNGEELFDLLKSTPDDQIVLSKPENAYFNTFDEISNDFNDDNFDVFEDILEKSIAVIDESLSGPVALTTEETITDTSLPNPEPKSRPPDGKRRNLKRGKSGKHRNRNRRKSEEGALNDESRSEVDRVSAVEDSDANTKDTGGDKPPKTVYCEICDKSFSRVESLTKHKRTLTHISKLSELEAKEAALKTKCDPKSTNQQSECRKDLNLLNILASVDGDECGQCPSPFDVTVRNSNLKLADIINDVLNKPMSKKDEEEPSFADAQKEVEVRRCKSLAERKSFESSESYKGVDYFNPEIANAAAGTILEKQITLLENIIENRGVGYIDEISVSSSPSIDKNSSECNSKETDPVDQSAKETKTDKESFLKPTQYEEISDDSNLRNYDEQKSRKALNRDEELFLECCSLLKSGSEVSSYSKKSNNISKDVTKTCDESDWLETNYLSQQGNSDFAECYSDGSRIRTPLGDGFSQDSNSATLSSQWNMNTSCTPTKKQIWKEELKGKNLTFEEVFGTKDEDIYCKDGDNLEDLHSMVSSFDRVISEVLNTELRPSGGDAIKRCANTMEGLPREPYEKESTSADARKVLTKGAMKIFEGLKVSIPTEDLNIDKILISKTHVDSPPLKPTSRSNGRVQSKSPPKKPPRCTPKMGSFKKQAEPNSKVHDVYDFEETQDNSDVFTKPDFRSFRSSSEKCKKPEDGSDDDSRDCTDPFGLDAMSSSTSSVPEVVPVARSRHQQNITKKKCMIMGRIFKNVVVKSKVEDEDIRNIPVVDNTKLVEDFVLNCPEPEATSVAKKPRMTEEEMNLEFDKLLSKQTVKACVNRNNPNSRRKQKIRSKKRSHCNSDSSDDEFKLNQKHSLKRAKKKTANPEQDNCINLEQELRECIGVASRKSQRKCTSGKQNVLIEYWSSDESSFETLLERQIVNSVAEHHHSNHQKEEEEEEERREHPQIVHTEVKVCPKEPVEDDDPLPTLDVDIFSGKRASSNRSNRRKRVAANPLYHWSSSSEDESRDLIEIRPIRDEIEDDDRPIQHGWIVGDSPKKLVTMLAQAKGKKIDIDSVKEHGRKRPSVCS